MYRRMDAGLIFGFDAMMANRPAAVAAPDTAPTDFRAVESRHAGRAPGAMRSCVASKAAVAGLANLPRPS